MSASEDWWEGEDNISLRLSLGCFVIGEVKRKIGEDWRDDGEVGVGCCDMLAVVARQARRKGGRRLVPWGLRI